ncbi:MAG: transcription antitermination factor NusB [Chloroflexota bacterium]|nr:transcription antitermination factor NusB [Chloroflexota bacterium]
MKSRTKARSIALQVLYEVDISGHKPGKVLEDHFLRLKIDNSNKIFISQIVSGVTKYKKILDEFIADFAPEWPLNQLAYIDLNLLRIGLWEMGVYRNTPVKVVINEAVELAKLYGAEGSPRFVNGVLGGFIDNLEEIKFNMEIIQENDEKQ